MFSLKPKMPEVNDLLPGRSEPMAITGQHYVNGAKLKPPFATGTQQAVFGLGCFWGAERCFWQLDGVITTAVGYAGGSTPNPTYHEVCSGMTGHTEAVLVVFDPARISYEKLLQIFSSLMIRLREWARETTSARNIVPPSIPLTPTSHKQPSTLWGFMKMR